MRDVPLAVRILANTSELFSMYKRYFLSNKVKLGQFILQHQLVGPARNLQPRVAAHFVGDCSVAQLKKLSQTLSPKRKTKRKADNELNYKNQRP